MKFLTKKETIQNPKDPQVFQIRIIDNRRISYNNINFIIPFTRNVLLLN